MTQFSNDPSHLRSTGVNSKQNRDVKHDPEGLAVSLPLKAGRSNIQQIDNTDIGISLPNDALDARRTEPDPSCSKLLFYKEGYLSQSEWQSLVDNMPFPQFGVDIHLLAIFVELLGNWMNLAEFRLGFAVDSDVVRISVVKVELIPHLQFSLLDKLLNTSSPSSPVSRDCDVMSANDLADLQLDRIGSRQILYVSSMSSSSLFCQENLLNQTDLGQQVLEDDALRFFVLKVSNGLKVSLEFPDRQHHEAIFEDMLETFLNILKQLIEDPTKWNYGKVNFLPMLQSKTIEQNNSTLAHFGEGLLTDGFQKCLLAYPENVAVVDNLSFSYSDIGRFTRVLQSRLQERGIKYGDRIAIALKKGWLQVVAVLATLEIGASYVPVDISAIERMSIITATAGVKAIITDSKDIQDEKVFLTPLDEVRALEIQDTDSRLLDGEAERSDIAYIIFTSGSTGVPKGVVISHQGARNTCLDMIHRFSINSTDRVLAISSLNFDLSVFDIFGPTFAGGSIVMLPEGSQRDPSALYESVTANEVTIWNSVPAILEILILYVESSGLQIPPSLRLIILSGDWISVSLVNRVKRLSSHNIVIACLGGATEASIWSNYFIVPHQSEDLKTIPYGRPLANQEMRVLDHKLRDCCFGVTGSLYISGAGLALGYINNPRKTAASFIRSPWTGIRLYKTGDHGRYLPDGQIEFLGRSDGQVKINGHRIELGEIETVLSSDPAVKAAVVVIYEEVALHSSLKAYLIPQADREDEKEGLIKRLLSRLPRYMIPSSMIWISDFPLTTNGKVDRAALVHIGKQDRKIIPVIQPESGLQVRLLHIWSSILGHNRSHINDNFFEMGGNSFLATKLAVTLRTCLSVEFPLRLVFENQTVADLSLALEVLGVH